MIANINGVQIFYETVGSGPPLVAVHGGPGLADHRIYAQWLQQLAESHQIVYYDLRGCGQSGNSPTGTYSHSDFVSDLDGLRAHLGFEQMALLGWSYGGFISLEYALRHQDRLTHLMLSDTASSGNDFDVAKQNAIDAGLPGINPQMLDALFAGKIGSDDEFRSVFAAIQPLYSTKPDPVADAAALEQMIFRHQTHNYAFSKNLPQFDLRSRLPEIRTPTLVLCGRHDWITPLKESEFIAAHIPNAELVVFEESGHGPLVEENAAFVQALRRFMAESQKPATA